VSARERGSVTVFMVAAIALAAVLMTGIARVGGAAAQRARADSAADAAALAAADELALGHDARAASAAARETASANGARLVSCECTGTGAEVVVVLGAATGRARAEVDFGNLLAGSGLWSRSLMSVACRRPDRSPLSSP
jgi:secretion/DNA translocation related TadE-like protein